MPSLLNGGQPIKGTAGTSTIFITLPTAQLSLGKTPSTSTGFTLVTGANGQLTFTSTIGGVTFANSIIQTQTPNGNLSLQSNGTGTLNLNGNILINGNALTFNTGTIVDLTVLNTAKFLNTATTVLMDGGLFVNKDVQIGGALSTFGAVFISPTDASVTITPQGIGSVDINPATLGAIDNMQIGVKIASSASFTTVTAGIVSASSIFVNGQPVGGGSAEISDTPPLLPYVGKFWWDSTVGVLRVYYNDGTHSMWIDASPSIQGDVGPQGPKGDPGVSGAISTTTNNLLHITDVTVSTSTNTGALTVAGGVGIGGSLYAAQIFSNGLAVLTSATVASLGVSQLIVDPSGLYASGSTGSVTLRNIDTLDSIVIRGSTSSHSISITSSTVSTSTISGALTVVGGVGIGGDLFVGNAINVMATDGTHGSITYTSPSNTFVVNGSIVPSPSNSRGLGAATDQWNSLYAVEIFENQKRVITSVVPQSGQGIGISYESTTGPNVSYVISNLGVQAIYAGPGTTVNANTGTITISNFSSFQNVTDIGTTTTNAISITNTGNSALVVSGTIRAGTIFSNNAVVWTTATLYDVGQLTNSLNYIPASQLGLYGVTKINPGYGISVNISTGSVTVTNIGVVALTAGTGISLSSSSGAVIVTNVGVTSLTVGANTDIALSTSSGIITLTSTSTLQTVTDRGPSTTNAIEIKNTTFSSAFNNGALVVTGGVGVGGNINVLGAVFSSSLFDSNNRVLTSVNPVAGLGINLTNTAVYATSSTFTINNSGVLSLSGTQYLGVSNYTGNIILTNLGVQSLVSTAEVTVSASTGSNISIGLASTLQSVTSRGSGTNQAITLTNITDSVSTTSGALVVTGGVGVGGKLNVGDQLTVSGQLLVQNNLIISKYPIIYDQRSDIVDTTLTILDSFPTSLYRSAKYLISASNAGSNQYQTTEILLIQDGVNASIEQTSVFSGADNLMIFSAMVTAGTVLLRGIGSLAGNIVKVQPTYITI